VEKTCRRWAKKRPSRRLAKNLCTLYDYKVIKSNPKEQCNRKDTFVDRLEKRTKKTFIGKAIDLAGGHFKDDEINVLYDLVKFRVQLSGLSKTYECDENGRTPDGKEVHITSSTYIFVGKENLAFVREQLHYIDRDGQEGGWSRDYRTAREILGVIEKIFR
jgi:hypothetical protein